MIQLFAAGFLLGVGAAVGQDVAEKYIIPASKEFYKGWCEAWDEMMAESTKDTKPE